MSIEIRIRCDHTADTGDGCGSSTWPAAGIAEARGLALTAGWYLGGPAGDRCSRHNARNHRIPVHVEPPAHDRRIVR